jgi:predicted permease
MLSDLYIRLRSLVRSRQVESELDTELQFHMENEIREHVGRGMSPAEAERRVRLAFGGMDQVKEDCREARGITAVYNLLRDVQYGARKLIHDWRFSVSALVILTLGIGVNTAMFSFVNSVVLRPRPFAESDRLVNIYQDSENGDPESNSFPAYRDMAAMRDVFSGVAAWYPATPQIERDGEVRTGLVDFATSNMFAVLGVEPSLGRWFSAAEEEAGTNPVAVLTHGAWDHWWGRDPDIVGRTVRINGAPVTIIGVGPEGFNGGYPGIVFDFWLSLSSLGPVQGPYAAGTLDRRGDHWFQVKARLADGVEVSAARAAMGALANRLAEDYPDLNAGREITLFEADQVRMHPTADGLILSSAALLLGAMVLVLAIASCNLAILLLVRGTFRAREVSIRLAMGASRGRIVSQFLVESVLLSLAGGSFGLLLADNALRLLTRVESAAPVPATMDLALDYRVLMFTFVLSTMTGVAFGLIPALRSSKADLSTALRDGSAILSIRRRWLTLRNVLVMSQVAASFLLLVAAALLTRSLSNAERTDVGFRVDDVAFLTVDPERAGYEGDALTSLADRLLTRTGAIPGVGSVARANVPPFRGPNTTTTSILIDGYQPPSGTRRVEVTRLIIDPEYLDTLAIPLREGRNFTATDGLDSEDVALINETMARRYFGTTDAIGGRVGADEESWVRVIGVVGDTRVADPTEPVRPIYYRPVRQLPFGPVTIMARTRVDPEALVEDMQAVLRQIDPTIPVIRARSMRAQLEDSLEGAAAGTAAIGAIGLLALGLAGIGLYAVVAFAVSQRSLEIGIRMALGSGRWQVLWLTCREVLVMAGSGVAIGLALSIAVTRLLEGLLFGVSPVDPITLVTVIGMMALVSISAAYLPIRRATARNPLDVLRRS